MGFFPAGTFIASRPTGLIAECGSCGIYQKCNSPKMAVTGKGKKKILVVGEAPGEKEDAKNKHFVDASGQLLRNRMKRHGIDLDIDCWKTNSIICHPPKNATPTSEQVGFCYPNMKRTLNELRPEVIITVGQAALVSVTKGIWLDGIDKIGRWVGWQIPCQALNAWITPLWHPSFILRMKDKPGGSPAPLLWDQQLKAACSLERRPWDVVPNYRKRIKVVLDDEEAARIIRRYIRLGDPVAFDYETNMLKPDRKEAKIRTASICRKGKETIAFPFQGRAVKAFAEMLMSPLPKIAQNFKFEDRWAIRVKLKSPDGQLIRVRVNSWVWDTMNEGHVDDNRPGCTGLAFLGFVHFGIGSYDHKIHPFLYAKHANEFNRVEEIAIEELCYYNGLDSLITWMVAEKQWERLRYKPF